MKHILLIAIAASLTRCATILTKKTGPSYQVYLQCKDTATVYYDGDSIGVTNQIILLPPVYKNTTSLLVKKGSQVVKVDLSNKINPYYWMNILNLFCFAWLDIGNGKAMVVKNHVIEVKF